MKIAINTRMLLKNKLEGIGRFTYEITKRIVVNHPEIEFHFLFDRPFNNEFIFAKNVVPHVLMPPTRHPFLWYAWFEWSVPMLLKKINPHAFLSADGYLSLSSNIPTHLTIHDLAFEHYPHAIPFLVQKFYKYYVPKYAHQAKQIATVSNFSKNDIIHQYKIDDKKIDVVYNAASNYFEPINQSKKTAQQKKISNGSPYFVCVSSIHPRKNISNLLLAFNEFKITDTANYKLVLIGDFMFADNDIKELLNNLPCKTDIVFTRNLPHHEISKIQAAADATCYVSLFEGFGIPIIESMQCGVPVITSNISSMPEVAADAALLVNPHDMHSIAQGLKTMATNTILKEQLIIKGLQRSKFFNWDLSAINYWKSVEQIF